MDYSSLNETQARRTVLQAALEGVEAEHIQRTIEHEMQLALADSTSTKSDKESYKNQADSTWRRIHSLEEQWDYLKGQLDMLPELVEVSTNGDTPS